MLTTEDIPLLYLELEIYQRMRKVQLMCEIKCHRTSALLASEMLSCPSGQAYKGYLVGKTPLGKKRRRLENNI
jgi:hypothetical protein